VVTTIHRLDYHSGKWEWFARTCLRLGEQISLRTSHRVIVVAPFLQGHYRDQGYQVEYIPNGVTLPSPCVGSELIRKLDLMPNQYILFLGRLVPEKRPDWAIRAFMESHNKGVQLVIAGGSSATDEYVQELKALAESAKDSVLFTGPVYGQLKAELLANAGAFILPSALEGLPITLLEAMSYGKPCLVSDIPPHQDVVQDDKNGLLYHESDFSHLCKRLEDLLRATSTSLVSIGKAARETVAESYDWEKVIDQTESLYTSLLESP
jgi:glycosyltransferase involved in cell wall biosynthesis